MNDALINYMIDKTLNDGLRTHVYTKLGVQPTEVPRTTDVLKVLEVRLAATISVSNNAIIVIFASKSQQDQIMKYMKYR
jgi:hypothetical protein